jgi:hypothetical protein
LALFFKGNKTIKKVLKILKYIAIVLVLFILLIQFFLWTSFGQTLLAKQATSYLEKKLNTTVHVEKVDISFFKFVRLEKLFIADQQQDTLFYIHNLDIEIESIIFKNDTALLDFGLVQIDQPVYNLNQLQNDSITSLSFFIDAFNSDDTSSGNLELLINASDIIVTDGHFIWDNENIDPIPFGVDWDHIELNQINLDITNFKMVNDSFNGTFESFSWQERSGFELNNFTGNAIFSSTTTKIENLKIITPNSNLELNLDYTYDSITSYVEFIDEVYMKYQVDTSIVNFKDIAYFAPTLKGLDYEVKVFGKERGPVNDMKFQDLFIQYGEATILNGRIFILGLPDFESTSFTCKFKQLSSNYTDLSSIKTYPFNKNQQLDIPHFLKNAGTIDFKGNFTGFYNDFVTYGTFKSDKETVNTDLQLAQEESGTIRYRGAIKTTDFNLARIMNQYKLLGKVSMDIQIEGENLDFDKMTLKVKGNASRFDFMGYKYTKLSVDAAIKDQTITGILDVIDTNINLAFDGSIALGGDVPRYEFKSTVQHLKPKQLHLMEKDSSSTLSTEVLFNFQGNSFDNILGRAGLRNFHYKENGKEVTLEKVDFIGFTIGKDKTLALSSDNMTMQITGEFYFRELLQSLNYVTYKWLPSMYSEPQIKPESVENFHLILKAKKFSGFSAIFIPGVTFEKDLNIDFSFNSDDEQIQLYAKSSRMNFAGQDVTDLNLEAKLTPDTFNLITRIGSVLFTDSNYIENFNIKSEATKNLVKSNIHWDNYLDSNKNSGDINMDLQFIDPENFQIDFKNSWLTVKDTLWSVHDSSEIIKRNKEYIFNNVMLTQSYQHFKLNGFISEDPEKELTIEVDSFNLHYLNPLFKKFNIHTEGIVDGTTVLKDVYQDIRLYSNSNFKDLSFNHQKLGSGYIKSEWDANEKRFDIDVNFENDTLKTITLNGSYYPQRKEDKLDLDLTLDHFPVRIIEPFFLEYIDQISGSVNGRASLKGTIKEPLLEGDFTLNDIQTRVIYLNEVLYVDNQNVFIRPNLIGADAIYITDASGKKAQVNFSLFHHNFDDINFDLAITSINVFRAFNTTKADNDYFYGTVHLNPGSTIGIDSDYDGNLNLSANIKSGPGTKVYIPFFEDDEVAQKDYIYFKDINIQTDAIPIDDLHKEETFGLNMDMSMELNDNAVVQLIFDEFTSDKIQAQGNGTINLKINEDDDFSIYGNYEISEGFYLFTFSKVISKRFAINPGSRLTWNGDPYKGQADITASYKVRTALFELGITAAYDTAELKKRVPVDVMLKMTGNYMNPDLSFSFRLPSKYDEIQTLLNNLDEGERNKQVFGLLILNKFMPIIGTDVSAGSSVVATNSTEVLSNQLSNWLSKISNDFDVGVRYSPGDNITADEVEVALSTQLFNDRVLVETNFGILGNVSNSTSTKTNNFVGEFTISYKINRNGNIVGKVFNRSNELNPVDQNISPYTQGIGIAYTEPFKSWDNLGCILSNHLKKVDYKRDCESEYYKRQDEESEKNLALINKKVARSRKKHHKRKLKKEKKSGNN